MPSAEHIYFAKYSVFVVELICPCQSEEELAAVVVWACIRHGNQTSPNKP
jgi:hypothetical protein